jgi:hypothetical protein
MIYLVIYLAIGWSILLGFSFHELKYGKHYITINDLIAGFFICTFLWPLFIMALPELWDKYKIGDIKVLQRKESIDDRINKCR